MALYPVRVVRLLLVTAMLMSTLRGQQPSAAPKAAPKKTTPNANTARPGTMSGRVFAITASGDLKPARLAKVYVFYKYRIVSAAEASQEQEHNSVGEQW